MLKLHEIWSYFNSWFLYIFCYFHNHEFDFFLNRLSWRLSAIMAFLLQQGLDGKNQEFKYCIEFGHNEYKH